MPTSDWSVGLSTVGAILRARTRDTQGTEVGTFNTETRPTGTQVTELISTAVLDLASAVGPDIPEAFWSQASTVASYKAAMLTELSYFPEQVAAGRSPYEQIKELYTEALKGLKVALAGSGTDLPGDSASFPSPPSYGFQQPSSLDTVLGPSLGQYTNPYTGTTFQ